MSITFSCEHCGKSFTVDAKFGGKKGRCKQCNAVISIPSAAASDFADEPEPTPVRRTQTVTARPVAARPAAPKVDAYDFDDEPLPARIKSAGPRAGAVDQPVETMPARPGLYDAPRKKKKGSSGAASVAMVVGRIVIGVLAAFGGLIGLAVGLPALQSFRLSLTGFAGKGEIQRLFQERIDDHNSLADILTRVSDVPSAQTESARAIAGVRKLTENLKTLKDLKGLKADIDEVGRTTGPGQIAATQRVVREAQRIKASDDVWMALSIQSAFDELAAIEATIPGLNQGAMNQGFQAPPPNFNRPPPTFTPPQPPNFAPKGRPGGMPNMPPRIGPRRGSRPNG